MNINRILIILLFFAHNLNICAGCSGRIQKCCQNKNIDKEHFNILGYEEITKEQIPTNETTESIFKKIKAVIPVTYENIGKNVRFFINQSNIGLLIIDNSFLSKLSNGKDWFKKIKEIGFYIFSSGIKEKESVKNITVFLKDKNTLIVTRVTDSNITKTNKKTSNTKNEKETNLKNIRIIKHSKTNRIRLNNTLKKYKLDNIISRFNKILNNRHKINNNINKNYKNNAISKDKNIDFATKESTIDSCGNVKENKKIIDFNTLNKEEKNIIINNNTENIYNQLRKEKIDNIKVNCTPIKNSLNDDKKQNKEIGCAKIKENNGDNIDSNLKGTEELTNNTSNNKGNEEIISENEINETGKLTISTHKINRENENNVKLNLLQKIQKYEDDEENKETNTSYDKENFATNEGSDNNLYDFKEKYENFNGKIYGIDDIINSKQNETGIKEFLNTNENVKEYNDKNKDNKEYNISNDEKEGFFERIKNMISEYLNVANDDITVGEITLENENCLNTEHGYLNICYKELKITSLKPIITKENIDKFKEVEDIKDIEFKIFLRTFISVENGGKDYYNFEYYYKLNEILQSLNSLDITLREGKVLYLGVRRNSKLYYINLENCRFYKICEDCEGNDCLAPVEKLNMEYYNVFYKNGEYMVKCNNYCNWENDEGGIMFKTSRPKYTIEELKKIKFDIKDIISIQTIQKENKQKEEEEKKKKKEIFGKINDFISGYSKNLTDLNFEIAESEGDLIINFEELQLISVENIKKIIDNFDENNIKNIKFVIVLSTYSSVKSAKTAKYYNFAKDNYSLGKIMNSIKIFPEFEIDNNELYLKTKLNNHKIYINLKNCKYYVIKKCKKVKYIYPVKKIGKNTEFYGVRCREGKYKCAFEDEIDWKECDVETFTKYKPEDTEEDLEKIKFDIKGNKKKKQ